MSTEFQSTAARRGTGLSIESGKLSEPASSLGVLVIHKTRRSSLTEQATTQSAFGTFPQHRRNFLVSASMGLLKVLGAKRVTKNTKKQD